MKTTHREGENIIVVLITIIVSNCYSVPQEQKSHQLAQKTGQNYQQKIAPNFKGEEGQKNKEAV